MTPRLSLLGRPSLVADGDRRIGLPRKAFALAAMLLIDPPDGPLPRVQAAKFLWGDTDSSRRMGNLRQLLARLRELQTTEGLDLFVIGADHVAIDADAASIDLVELMEARADAPALDLVRLARAYTGDLLADLDDGDIDHMRWLESRRASLRERFVALMTARVEGAVGLLEPGETAFVARRLLEVAPLEQSGHRALVRSLVAQGRYESAIRAHRRFLGLLRAAGEAPDPVTALIGEDLSRRTRDAGIAQVDGETIERPQPPATPMPGVRRQRRPEVAIRETGAGDLSPGERARLAAVAEETTLRLWHTRAFVVTRRVEDTRPVEIETSRYVVTLQVGDVAGERRLTARLESLADHEVLWIRRFDTADSVMRIARDTATGCVHEIEQVELRLLDASPDNTDVFRLTLQGNRLLRSIDLRSIRRARGFFRMALTIDGDHAQVLAALAKAFRLEWLLLARGDDDELDQALDHARKSLALAPDGAHGLHQLGVCNVYKRNHDLGLALLRQSERLNPYDEELIGDLADALIVSGRAEEGIAKVAALLDDRVVPSDQALWILASGQYLTRRYDDALATLSRLTYREPAYQLIAACHAMRSDTREAADYARKLREILPDFDVAKRLRLVPLRRREDLEHYEEGLRRAGLD